MVRGWGTNPIGHRIVIPYFAIVTGIGTIPVAIRINERCEAWKWSTLWHFGQAVLACQELQYLRQKMCHLQIVTRTWARLLECGIFVTSWPCQVKMTACLTARKCWDTIKLSCPAVGLTFHDIIHICRSKWYNKVLNMRWAACFVNETARFCVFRDVNFASGMCADLAYALFTLSGTP
jgi:hypothetical protein